MVSVSQIVMVAAVLLGVVLVVVVPFLVFIYRSNQAIAELHRSCHSFQLGLNQRSAEAFAEVVVALKGTADALSRNSVILGNVESQQSRTGGSVRT